MVFTWRCDEVTGVNSVDVRKRLNKVPEVTLWFWIIKVLCTTVGESLADYINTSLRFGLDGTAVLFTGILAVVLILQFRSRQYVPTVYWLTVVVISVTGTLYTDILTDEQSVALKVSSAVFAVALVVVFGVWWLRERTLSIHSIVTAPREAFYWLTVLVTFALGTATGDWTLELTGWTPGKSALLPIALIAVVFAGWRAGANAVLAFWLAYILTRPLGANLGDYLGLGSADGGLGLGTLGTSLIFLGAIAATVLYLTRSRADVVHPDEQADRADVRPRSLGRERAVLAAWVLSAVLVGFVLNNSSHHKGSASAAESESAPTVPVSPGQKSVVPFSAADEAPLKAIAADTLALVAGGQQARAVTRVGTLETAWDDAQPTLRAQDPQDWITLDQKIDKVLKSVRASPPDMPTETSALTTLLGALNA